MTTVTVRTSVDATHWWPNAPDAVAFLRHRHAHRFLVTLAVSVEHADRAVEFWLLTDTLKQAVNGLLVPYPHDVLPTFGTRSCEQIANELRDEITDLGYVVASVKVSEDGHFDGAVW